MYLPLSLPLVFTDSTVLLMAIMLTVSLPTHASAVLVWASLDVAREVYTKRRLAQRLVAVSSGVLSFFAASLSIRHRLDVILGIH
jgi:hypothetical protein